MSLKRILGKQLLLDTCDENDIFNKQQIVDLGDGQQIKFTSRELVELADAEKMGGNVIQSILKLSPSIERKEPVPSIFIYKNSEGLPVFIKTQNEYYLVVAQGEFQYGRYKLYLEGVFQKTPSTK